MKVSQLSQWAVNKIALRQLFRRHLQEPHIVIPFHPDIHIVIPRDKSIVPYGSQQRSTISKISNAILFAYSVNLCQYFHFRCPPPLHFASDKISVSYLIFKKLIVKLKHVPCPFLFYRLTKNISACRSPNSRPNSYNVSVLLRRGIPFPYSSSQMK